MKKTIATILSLIALATSGTYVYLSTGITADKDIVTYAINNANGIINQTSGEIDVTLPLGTNLSNLTANFTTTGAKVAVNGGIQYSGITENNFTNNVLYVVTAGDGSIKDYLVHVLTSSIESGAYFQSFSINSNTNGGLSQGIVTGNNIAVTVPSDANLSNMTGSYSYIGSSVFVGSTAQINNITNNNFSSPVTYTINALDGSSNNYNVTVTKASPTDDTMQSFSLITSDGIFNGTINGTNIHVGVPSDIVLNNVISQFSSNGSLVKIGAVNQISGLTVNNFTSPVSYTVISGDGSTSQNYTVTVDNYLAFLNVQNISNTIFDNINYPVAFNINNEESATINGMVATVNMPAPFVWTQTSDTCTGNNLSVGASCAVTGNLIVPKKYDQAAISFTLKDSSGVSHASFNQIVTSIAQLTELESTISNPQTYAAYRFPNAGSHRLFATAVVNGNNICFDSNNVGSITTKTESYGGCAVEMVKGNNTLYIPAYPGVGGKVLLSMDNRLPDGPTPSVTATNPSNTYYTTWQQVEYGGGLNSSSQSVLFNLNPTNVDFTSVPVAISTAISGVVGPYNNNSYVTQGYVFGNNILTQQVLNTMASSLANVPGASPQSWGNLTQLNAGSSSILRILSPGTVWPFMSESTSQFYFNGTFYNQYINDLWAYYTDNIGGHYLYSNDDPVAALVHPADTCTLQCQVTHVDNLMHCVAYSGQCPTNSTTGTVDGEYNTGGESSGAGFTKFTPLDFVSAAGTPSATTYGFNGTYRSVTGENIVSGQSVGFMPFCSNASFLFGEPTFNANMSLYYTSQYNCLSNFSTYESSVLDQYSLQSSLYFHYYNYGYSDTLNQPGSLYSLNNESFPFTINVNYQ